MDHHIPDLLSLQRRMDLVESELQAARLQIEQIDTREREGRSSLGRAYLLLDQSLAELRKLMTDEQRLRTNEDDAQDTAITTIQTEVRAAYHLMRYAVGGGGMLLLVIIILLVVIALQV